MKKFFTRCWQRRWLRGAVWSLLGFVAICVVLWTVLCAWMNWSGARRWREVQAIFRAEGETLDFRETMHAPVPEGENFCAIPLLKDLALVVDNNREKGAPGERRKRLIALKLPVLSKGPARLKFTGAMTGVRVDLKSVADSLRAEGSLPVPADSGHPARDLLAALSKHDAVFQELAAGLNRPKAQWTPEWKTRDLPGMVISIALPHYDAVIATQRTLALRAIAAAGVGEDGWTKAHESAQILAQLSEASLHDPFLIGLLVGISHLGMLCSATWEICAAHAGTAEDFARLESAIANLDLHRALLHASRSELASAVGLLQFLKSTRDGAVEILSLGWIGGNDVGAFANAAEHAIPAGFFDASCAFLAERELRHIVRPVRDGDWRAALRAAKEFEDEIIGMKATVWTHPEAILTAMVVPVTTNVTRRAAHAQAVISQAVIACALERHRLARGSYPDALAAVQRADGAPLPLDEMSGKPMGYRKTADGKYALWSIGLDGRDDGGKRVLNEENPEGTSFHDENHVGDWVWDFPGK